MTTDVSGLIIAAVAVAFLALVMRWVFKPSHRAGPGAGREASTSAELGLLDVVAVDLTREQALTVRARLGDAGMRSSMSMRRDGNLDVLVFHDDAERARDLLG